MTHFLRPPADPKPGPYPNLIINRTRDKRRLNPTGKRLARLPGMAAELTAVAILKSVHLG
jgi:hypothetical protein